MVTRRQFLYTVAAGAIVRGQRRSKTLIAHRGASAYAPENTLPAYQLAIEQGADFVEQDLQITRDGVLVCLHDATLERTTDVARVFPQRARLQTRGGQVFRSWPVADFTLEEIRQLDAGSWFDEKFQGTRVPTFQEAIDAIRGKAGLYPELKAPGEYRELGVSMEKLVWETLQQNRLHEPGADPRTPVVIQSFSAEALRNLRELGCRLPMTFLIGRRDGDRWLTPAGLREIREFAEAIGPEKNLLLDRPELVRQAQELGLEVVPYTFRAGDHGKFRDVQEEMEYYLYGLGVDGLFTDNPDLFPRKPRSGPAGSVAGHKECSPAPKPQSGLLEAGL